MAKQSASKSKEVAKIEQKGVIASTFEDSPDYLPTNAKGTSVGMENMGKDDYKIPRISLLQGLSPQLETFPEIARKDTYWHSGMNLSLGKEFIFVPIIASKRVILWRPRNDDNGGILAFSKNGKTWDSGANSKFSIKVKGRKDPVVWNTGKDVLSSRLTEFGTSNPDDPQSAPAASVVYEYLIYLPDHPELSPAVLGLSKTAIPNGKTLNTSLMMQQRMGKPIQCLGVTAFVEEVSNGEGKWTIPNFKMLGFVNKDVYAVTSKMAESYSDYVTEYTQDETTEVKIDDNIAY